MAFDGIVVANIIKELREIMVEKVMLNNAKP